MSESAPKVSESLGRRLLRAAMLPAAFTVVAILLLLFTPSGQQWTRWLDDQVRVEETRGRIVDATTGKGVAGATVVVHSLTEKWKPSIVGEIAHGVASTDGDGRFVVRYQRLANSRISARAPGYATIFRVPLGEKDVELPTSPAAPGGVDHRGEVGFDLADSTSEVFFDLARDTVLEDAAAADFVFRIDSAASDRVVLLGLGQAGIATEHPPSAANEIDPLAASCLAPDTGYVAILSTEGNVSNFTAFARLHDGNRYCRMKLRVYGRGPTPNEGYRVEIERWLNTTGSRNVCVVPIEGEANEFAPADRPKR